MKRILITNDDGFSSIGLAILRESVLQALGQDTQVLVVAPAHEKSACGHGLSITKPLYLNEVRKDFYKLDDGSPTDCIYLALYAFYKDTPGPDLVLSGINLGSNMGEDTTYSGTVAGAMEAALRGIPSMAISQVLKNKHVPSVSDFDLAIIVVSELVKKFFDSSLDIGERKFLNVNIPPISPEKYKGYKITQKGYRFYDSDVSMNCNPRGKQYYWLGDQPLSWRDRKANDNNESNGCLQYLEEYLDAQGEAIVSDFRAIQDGYVSITPITTNLTSYADMQKVAKWLKG